MRYGELDRLRDRTNMNTAAGAQLTAATVERDGHVAVITLNRPDALNAVNAEMSAAVGQALAELAHDPELRVGVVTGAGRAFCAGADLKALARGESLFDDEHPERGLAGLVGHFVDKPIIAAVNGPALGGGAELVMACDLAVCSEDAMFGLPEVSRGVIAAAGGLIRLPRQVPVKVAMEAALTGEPIDAATAARWGLVNRVVPAGDVLDCAMRLARTIAGNAPLAVRASKRIIHRWAGADSDWGRADWERVDEEFQAVLNSRDAHEGVVAFAEKRPPVWTGS